MLVKNCFCFYIFYCSHLTFEWIDFFVKMFWTTINHLDLRLKYACRYDYVWKLFVWLNFRRTISWLNRMAGIFPSLLFSSKSTQFSLVLLTSERSKMTFICQNLTGLRKSEELAWENSNFRYRVSKLNRVIWTFVTFFRCYNEAILGTISKAMSEIILTEYRKHSSDILYDGCNDFFKMYQNY